MRPPPTNRPNRTPFWKVLLIIAGVGLGLALVVRVAWGWHAQRMLDAKFAALRAAGVPLGPEELPRPTIDPADDAVPLFRQAQSALVTRERISLAFETLCGLELRPLIGMRDIRALHVVNARALEFLRQAAERPDADWLSARAGAGGWAGAVRYDAARLIPLCGLDAMLHLRQGRINDALEGHERSLRLAALIRRSPSDTYSFSAAPYAYFSSARAHSLLIARLGRDADDRPIPLDETTRALVYRIIEQLEQEQSWRDAWRESRRGSRVDFLVFTAPFWSSNGVSPWMRWLSSVAGPLFQLDVARTLDEYDRCEDFADAPSFPRIAVQATAEEYAAADSASMTRRISRPFLGIANPNDDPKTLFSVLASARIGATRFALRMYEIDHGRLPDSLADLVPEYLRAVPIDPFDPAGNPLRYLPHADPPLIYSVGINGQDDGGVSLRVRDGVQGVGERLDLVESLAPVALPAISEDVVPNDDQGEEDEGQPDADQPEGDDPRSR